MDRSALAAWWKLARSVAITAGVLLSFIAVIEIMRVYLILREFSPWFGIGFIVIVAGGLCWILLRFLIALRSLPQAPSPPEVSDPANPSSDEIDECIDFLRHRIAQLAANPALSGSQLESLEAVHAGLCRCTDREGLQEAYSALQDIFKPLDGEAERIVSECVRDVMLAVALSPYRSADLLMVLYRNGQMILQLARLYQTRPAPVEQFRILKDVAAIVAAVNFLNFTEKLVEQLLERVPVLGQLAGDVSQGLGAGLLTSAAGHAAIQRCRSIDPWNRDAARESLAGRMSSFARDVKSIFHSEVLPKLRPRVPDFASVPERISSAFDSAVESMGNWVWRPVKNGGTRIATATVRGGSDAWRKVQSGTCRIGERSRSLFRREKSQEKKSCQCGASQASVDESSQAHARSFRWKFWVRKNSRSV